MKIKGIFLFVSLHQVISTDVGTPTRDTKHNNGVRDIELSESPYLYRYRNLNINETKKDELLNTLDVRTNQDLIKRDDKNQRKGIKTLNNSQGSNSSAKPTKIQSNASTGNQATKPQRSSLDDDVPGCRNKKSITKSSPSSKEGIVAEAKIYAYLSATSYCDDKKLNSWSCPNCVRLRGLKLLKIVYEPSYNLRSLILLDDDRKDVIISLRGSDGVGQAFSLVSLATDNFLTQDKVRVQKKIKKRTVALFNLLKQPLVPILKDYGCYRKVLVGHSLGGAMATLMAPMVNDVFKIPYRDMAVYTYGSPRVGNVDFAKWYNNLKIHTIRVVNGRDSIPHSLGYPSFVHTHRELFVHKGDTLCSTSSLEDDKCSNSFTFHSIYIPTHNSVWGIRLGSGNC